LCKAHLLFDEERPALRSEPYIAKVRAPRVIDLPDDPEEAEPALTRSLDLFGSESRPCGRILSMPASRTLSMIRDQRRHDSRTILPVLKLVTPKSARRDPALTGALTCGCATTTNAGLRERPVALEQFITLSVVRGKNYKRRFLASRFDQSHIGAFRASIATPDACLSMTLLAKRKGDWAALRPTRAISSSAT